MNIISTVTLHTNLLLWTIFVWTNTVYIIVNDIYIALIIFLTNHAFYFSGLFASLYEQIIRCYLVVYDRCPKKMKFTNLVTWKALYYKSGYSSKCCKTMDTQNVEFCICYKLISIITHKKLISITIE